MGTVTERRELRPADHRAALVRLAPGLERLAYAVQPDEPSAATDQLEAEGTAEGGDAGLYVAPARGGEPERWLALEHPWRVEDIAFSPNGAALGYVLCRDQLEAPERFVGWGFACVILSARSTVSLGCPLI